MEQLGIQPVLLLAQIINFTIMVFVFKKLLYKPILTMLDKRRAEIKESVTRTEQIKEEEAKMAKKAEKMLDNARREVKDLLDTAKKQAKEQEKEIITQAHKQAESILEKAKVDAKEAAKSLEKEVRLQAINLSGDMVKKLLASALSDAEQKKVVSAGIADLRGLSKKSN